MDGSRQFVNFGSMTFMRWRHCICFTTAAAIIGSMSLVGVGREDDANQNLVKAHSVFEQQAAERLHVAPPEQLAAAEVSAQPQTVASELEPAPTLEPPSEFDLEQLARAGMGARFRTLDERVAAGAADPTWDPYDDVASYLRTVSSQSRIVTSRCTSDLCRFDVWIDSGSKRSFLQQLDPRLLHPMAYVASAAQRADIGVFAGGVLVNEHNDQPGITHIYLSRPGRHFGDADPAILPTRVTALARRMLDSPPTN